MCGLIGLFLLVSTEWIQKIHSGLAHDALVDPSGHRQRRSRHPLSSRFQAHTFSRRVEVPYWRHVLALLVIITVPPTRSRMIIAEEQSAATLTIDEGTSIRLDKRKPPKKPKQG
jgi:hypothetical protein